MMPDTSSENDGALRDIPLPSFIVKNDGGIFVDLGKLQMANEFEQFASRLFAAELLLRGLDYSIFNNILYDIEWVLSEQVKNQAVKLADGIACFQPSRCALYHGVKLVEEGKSAEYMFEPVSIEISYEEPVCGEPDASGVIPVLEYRTQTRLQADKLDFDEFIADMWLKDVRFGLDAETVRKCIVSGATQRVIIAHQLEPAEGRDAELKEASTHLHRDNSPKILATGKTDLRAFKNRFPQMAEGERMLQKIPRKLGKQGRKISGEVIEPALPQDLDLSALASSGTRIEQTKDGEFIVAAMSGFLNLDTHTNQVSITEKIESKAGISVRTTGNLDLSVDEFIEHGEVQEGRHVEGKHMTFMSGVFGDVLSHEGSIHIKSNLTGGKAEALNGNIEVSGKMSRSHAVALNGELVCDFVESSTLLGRVVRVKHAVNCEIIAEELHAGLLEGCSVAAKNILIEQSDERRGRETLVTVMIPDYSYIDQHIADLNKHDQDIRGKITTISSSIQTLRSHPDFAKFLVLEASIKQGAVKLNDEQHANWRKLVEKNTASVNQLSDFQSAVATLEQSLQKNASERNEAEQQRDALATGISCVISAIKGQTIGQTMKSGNGIDVFTLLPAHEIKALLHNVDSGKSRIFSGESGTISWQFAPS